MKHTLLASAAMMLFGTVGSAAVTSDSLIREFLAQGHTGIEVKTGPTQIKIEAIRATDKLGPPTSSGHRQSGDGLPCRQRGRAEIRSRASRQTGRRV